MKTDDLIRALAQDGETRPPSLAWRLTTALVAGGAVAAALFALILGVRPDVASALHTWRYVLKVVVALTLSVCALWACLRLAHPDRALRDVLVVLAIAPALLLLGIGCELATVPPAEWYTRAVGTNSLVCLTAIPALSILSLVATLAALRAGAPRSPTVSGAVAGLLAGGLAATLYATHCPDDSPLFVAVWYPLAIALVVFTGAVLGRRVLRW
jgi:hypothetical protein